MKTLKCPVTKESCLKNADKNGRISFTFESDFFDESLEVMNERFDDALGFSEGYMLSDLSYRASKVLNNGKILVVANASVFDLIDHVIETKKES